MKKTNLLIAFLILIQVLTIGFVLQDKDSVIPQVITETNEVIRYEQSELGEQGEVGGIGDKGEVGEQGLKGDRGDKGDKGDRGDIGFIGDKGDTSDKGEKGNDGLKGDKGLKGDTGDKGDKGDVGVGISILLMNDINKLLQREEIELPNGQFEKAYYVTDQLMDSTGSILYEKGEIIYPRPTWFISELTQNCIEIYIWIGI